MKTGIEAIAQERKEQIEKHGRTIEDDYMYNSSWPLALAKAASSLTMQPVSDLVVHYGKPDEWHQGIWEKMCRKPYKERLAIAGALIAAEYDRVQFEENLVKQQ